MDVRYTNFHSFRITPDASSPRQTTELRCSRRNNDTTCATQVKRKKKSPRTGGLRDNGGSACRSLTTLSRTRISVLQQNRGRASRPNNVTRRWSTEHYLSASRTQFTRRFYRTDPCSRVLAPIAAFRFRRLFARSAFTVGRRHRCKNVRPGFPSSKATADDDEPVTRSYKVVGDVSACYVLVDGTKLNRGENCVKCRQTSARDCFSIFFSLYFQR